jgi:Ca-activated chloride channel family protein
MPAAAPHPAWRTGDAALRWALLAWLLLVAAAVRPQWLGEAEPMPISGRDLMLAVDLSASMATTDLRLAGRPADRLAVVKALAQDFVGRREGDRVGLMVFGDRAYLHVPLTFDLAAVQAALAGLEVGLAGRETALGDAVALATRRLRELSGTARVLVLLTDGANTAGELTPVQAAWLAQREGIRIHTVGIGAERLRVVTPAGIRDIDPSADLDQATLRSLAERTGGTYVRAGDSGALERFYAVLDRLEPTASGTTAVRPARELFHWPLAGALLLAGWLARRRAGGSA